MERSDSDTTPDSVLLDRVGRGDEQALGQLYSRYASVVLAFLLARVPDRGVAEEVGADVWLACWRSAPAFRGDSQVLTWLLGIAKRRLGSHTRGRRLAQVPLDEETDTIPSHEDGPADLVVSADATRALVDILHALPPDLAETVTLAWLHELPYDEVAALVGVPTGTVKSRVSRARRRLRAVLRRQDA
ncbi:sigma-70 family RNA polymerase sigma factor [Nocardiopsis sp. NPDC007018]|uniref:RNA polymerase sigma factor n=1 Tax=Nocardiopsis sp. NPDC007018 TaxID=3155721 RepID=UPI0033EC9842